MAEHVPGRPSGAASWLRKAGKHCVDPLRKRTKREETDTRDASEERDAKGRSSMRGDGEREEGDEREETGTTDDTQGRCYSDER